MRRVARTWTLVGIGWLCLWSAPALRGFPAQTDLDDLMSHVLQRRDENWKKLQQYVLDEREQVMLSGPSGTRLWGEQRDYTWYIREGFFIRSPLRANNAGVAEAERLEYEEEFLKRARAREAQAKKRDAEAAPEGQRPSEVPITVDAILAQTRQPQFIDSAYFLRFKFEPGHYALVGRETLEKRDVFRIEYYPERLFTHEQDAESRRRAERRTDRKEDVEAATERALNKVSRVTLWVDPAVRQVLKYTFDNIDFDFLPGALFVRVDDLEAMMTMSEPFPNVWLPAQVQLMAGMMTAAGPFTLRYQLEYHDYRQATSTGRVTVPGATK